MEKETAELVRRMKEGDKEAFDALVRQYYGKTLRMAYLISGNEADSQDIVQETFVICYLNRGKLREPEHFERWLFKTLTREAWRVCRRGRREQPAEEIFGEQEPQAPSVLEEVMAHTRDQELYEAIRKRRTVREFLDQEVDFEAIKRILEAGNLAPTWNHNRNWSYIVLRTEEEKEYAFAYAKQIADKFDAEKYLNAPRPYPTTLAQKMYAYAMPRQYTMLKNAPYVVIPVFKCKELNGESVSKLNPFSTIWCVIENIFLAATAEGLGCSMRIPLNEEHDIVKAKLKVPPTYMIPVFIGIGYADPNEMVLEQNVADLDKQLHFGRWK